MKAGPSANVTGNILIDHFDSLHSCINAGKEPHNCMRKVHASVTETNWHKLHELLMMTPHNSGQSKKLSSTAQDRRRVQQLEKFLSVCCLERAE